MANMSIQSSSVRIVEVGPRDGLQNIKETIKTKTKLELIHGLQKCGLQTIELTSFVSPRAVPQLADAQEVVNDSKIQDWLKDPNIRLPVLVPNEKGLDDALKNKVKEVAVFVSATEGFSKANIKCSVEEGLERARAVAKKATKAGVAVRGYVSCIFSDPYDGPTPQSFVHRYVKSLIEAGCYEVSLGDTLGVGTPWKVHGLIKYLKENGIALNFLAGHFHDTYGMAVANVWEAYRSGVRVFDSSVAGLGGCPFAPGAKGNVATEDLVYMFHSSGIKTGIDLQKLVATGDWISKELSRLNSSRAGTALMSKQKPRIQWTKVKEAPGLLTFRSGENLKFVLNRPTNGNALTSQMMLELTSAIRDARHDPKISRLIITGRGNLFCMGVSLHKWMDRSAREAQYRLLADLLRAIDEAPQLAVACLNGHVCAGGIGLAFACDIRVAPADIQVSLHHNKFGSCLATIGKYVIREWGLGFARMSMLSARPVAATKLGSYHIVSIVADTGANMPTAIDRVLDILDRPVPGPFRIKKKMVEQEYIQAGTEQQSTDINEFEVTTNVCTVASPVKSTCQPKDNVDECGGIPPLSQAKV